MFRLVALVILAAPLIALQAQGTLPEWGRPLAPAEGRELRAEIGRLSRRLGVRENTLLAIARLLGANLRNISFPELVQRVQSQAERAAGLQSQIGELRTQIAALTDAAVRGPAEQALARATAAFNEGRLNDADREFAALENLRRSESEAARAAWIDAVEARARIAELRLDYDAAEGLRYAAAREERRLSTERQWHLVMGAANARFDQGNLLGDNAALERAIAIYRNDVLPLALRAERPGDWAVSQNRLGVVLLRLGEREIGLARLEEAIVAFRASQEEHTRERAPYDWAMAQSNLGSALRILGLRGQGRARAEEAAAAFQAALEEFPREQMPSEWATVQNNLGNALGEISKYGGGTELLEQAIAAYRLALQERTRDGHPLEWADTQNNLGVALRNLGARESGTARLEEAVLAYRAAAQELTRERAPLRWATVQHNLATVLWTLAQRQERIVGYEEALAILSSALEERTQERVPLDWADSVVLIAAIRIELAQIKGEARLLDGLEGQLGEASRIFERAGQARHNALAGQALRLIAEVRREIPY